jgi:hypothetical protein
MFFLFDFFANNDHLLRDTQYYIAETDALQIKDLI